MKRFYKLILGVMFLLLGCNLSSPFLGLFDPAPTSSPPVVVSGTPQETHTLTARQQNRIFQDLWDTVDQEYLYEDFNGVDWDAVHEDYQAKIDEGLSDQSFYRAMFEMLAELGDEHSDFLSPEEAAEEDAAYEGDLEYVGIGIFVGPVPERQRAVIYLVFPDSPADRVGIRPHDSILMVNGEPVLDEDGYMTDAIVGPEGTTVNLTVQYPGEEPRDLVVDRAKITGAVPVPYHLYTSPNGQRIGYILLTTFTDGTIGDQVEQALQDLTKDAPLDGLILDNRVNSGGFDTVMNKTIRYFVGGEIGYFVNRHDREPFRVDPEDINGSLDIPIVVLVGEGTVSFGEVFAGLLQESRHAYLIGETTEGNVEILWGYDFEDGSRAWIAHDTFVPADNPDADWENDGIIPDLHIVSNWDEITPGNDPVIQAALDYFDN